MVSARSTSSPWRPSHRTVSATIRRGDRRPPQGGLPRLVRQPRRRLDGPAVRKPADAATDAGGGRGRRLYPDAFPQRRAEDAECGLAGAGDRRGAGRAARPRAALPAPARRREPGRRSGSRDRPVRHPDGRRRAAASEVDELGADAWSHGASRRAWPAGCRPALPGRRGRRRLSATRSEHRRPTWPTAADRRGCGHRRAGFASALLDGCSRRPPPAARTGCCSRCGRTTGRARLLRRPRLRRGRPAPALLPRRRHRRRPPAPART